jgi:hypothetical protein
MHYYSTANIFKPVDGNDSLHGINNDNRKGVLVNDQRDAQFFSMYLSLFLTLYMFRAHRVHHQ